ncbi:hypothetical protein CIPAW_01G226400 [Carya illinoinensis]|uniref:Uncharacterized protein n=1 Tax=Carya illinoinensis TaxID=32201 RepID=A0A8T1RSL2_CARIL|nr:hypothetical protein CIPAW_01G226400 [Carya illinoinensis]
MLPCTCRIKIIVRIGTLTLKTKSLFGVQRYRRKLSKRNLFKSEKTFPLWLYSVQNQKTLHRACLHSSYMLFLFLFQKITKVLHGIQSTQFPHSLLQFSRQPNRRQQNGKKNLKKCAPAYKHKHNRLQKSKRTARQIQQQH